MFTHPFVSNPEAQLKKHKFRIDSGSKNYEQHSVGKIYISYNNTNNKYQYFSPFNEHKKKLDITSDVIEDIVKNNGTLLIYISKNKIYTDKHTEEYAKYIDLCPKIEIPEAKEIISELKSFIGVTAKKGKKYSRMLHLMERGVVIHHGSIPLKARLLIEKFVNKNYAKICFATSTLIQGINMPFDIVFIDNFKFEGEEEGDKSLKLKNLIGRAGRSTDSSSFDFGYVVVKNANIEKFCTRLSEKTLLKETSNLDQDINDNIEDLKDITESIKNDCFDATFQLPSIQIERLKAKSVFKEVKYILDNFINDKQVITQTEYRSLSDGKRGKIKEAFKNIFVQHLRRKMLSKTEQVVLSTAISILIWKVEHKSFSKIVSFRYAFLADAETSQMKFSQVAYSLPNTQAKSIPLFKKATLVSSCNYDKLIYDTYDYLDKVISQSLTDPLCAAFHLYYDETKDEKAIVMKNYIRYGTNDEKEIWLIKYGFEFDDIEGIKPHIKSIDENEIKFLPSIESLDPKQKRRIERFVHN